MTPAAPPARDSRIASARNWARIWPQVAPSARRSPISERRSSTEMTMMLATPNRADQQRDRAQSEEQGVERALGVGLGGERVRGLGDVHLAGVFRVGLRAEQAVDCGGGGLGVDGAGGDLRGAPVEGQVLLRRGGRERATG